MGNKIEIENIGSGTVKNVGNTKTTKVKISIGAVVIIGVIGLVVYLFTGMGGIPDGSYAPTAITMAGTRIDTQEMMTAYANYSIEINGNNFGFKMGGVTQSAKYTYKNGKLSISQVDGSIQLDIEYKDNTLFWNLGSGVVLELKR